MKRFLCLVMVSLVLCAACGGGGHPSASVVTPATGTLPPVTPAPATTVPAATTTTTIDVAVVPSRITVAYVTAVLKVLNHIYGNAVRSTVAAGKFTSSALVDIDTIYTRRQAALEEKSFIQTATSGGLRAARSRPGDPTMRVIGIIQSSRTCVVAHVHTNFDRVTRRRTSVLRWEYIGIRRVRPIDRRINSSGWTIFYDMVFSSNTHVRNECDG